jgi:hypothetical protein
LVTAAVPEIASEAKMIAGAHRARTRLTLARNALTNGNDWVELTPQAQEAVDRLVALAGERVDDGTSATTAWSLVQAWLTSRTEESGWQQAWRVPARTRAGQAVFVVVRHGSDQPWRILSLTR